MKSLILASTSPYRREQLQRFCLPFEAIGPECDEDSFKNQGLSVEDLAQTLALEKAKSILKDHPKAIVIGADQVAAIDGKILSKPMQRDKACEQLGQLQGKTHQLLTAVCVLNGDKVYQHLEKAELSMAKLTKAQIERYVEKDLPLYSCGSYKIESFGVALFDKIEVNDFTSIVGLPMLYLGQTLREIGFQFP